MENLNAEQVKRGLECCRYGGRCAECPCFEIPNCQALVNENALALINSQEQRIKELTESYNSLESHYLKVRDESLAENKRLTEENEKLLNEFESAPLGRFEFEILYKEKCMQLDVANRRIVELLADKEFSKINRTEFKKMIVSEMQERLKAYFGTYVLGYKIPLSEALKAVNQIAKEMLEGEK